MANLVLFCLMAERAPPRRTAHRAFYIINKEVVAYRREKIANNLYTKYYIAQQVYAMYLVIG